MIGELIAAAGRGETASPDARERIYAAVHARWEQEYCAPQNKAERKSDGPDAHSTKTIDRIDRRSRRASPPHARARRRFSRRAAGLAGIAATFAVAALTLGLWQRGGPALDVPAPLAQIARISGVVELARGDNSRPLNVASTTEGIEPGDILRTSSDARVALRMEDGVLLRLNEATELQFVDAGNLALVSGTIYVDAGSGISSTPLTVATPLGGVEHLGTQYEVAYNDARLRVRVREGRVAVRGDSRETIGVAGEQVEMDADGNETRSTIQPDDPAWNWAMSIATLPAAASYQLSDVLNWIARERGLTLSVANAATRQRIDGDMLVGLDDLNPLEALDVVQRTSGLQVEIRDTRLVVTN